MLNKGGSYDSARDFGSWIFMCFKNHLVDILRKREVRQVPYGDESHLGGENSPVEKLTFGEISDNLRRKIDALPFSEREVVYEYIYGEDSFRTLSLRRGKYPSYARTRFNRAVGRLRRAYDED